MTKQEIIAKVNELIAAPSVCAPVKSAQKHTSRIRTRLLLTRW